MLSSISKGISSLFLSEQDPAKVREKEIHALNQAWKTPKELEVIVKNHANWSGIVQLFISASDTMNEKLEGDITRWDAQKKFIQDVYDLHRATGHRVFVCSSSDIKGVESPIDSGVFELTEKNIEAINAHKPVGIAEPSILDACERLTGVFALNGYRGPINLLMSIDTIKESDKIPFRNWLRTISAVSNSRDDISLDVKNSISVAINLMINGSNGGEVVEAAEAIVKSVKKQKTYAQVSLISQEEEERKQVEQFNSKEEITYDTHLHKVRSMLPNVDEIHWLDRPVKIGERFVLNGKYPNVEYQKPSLEGGKAERAVWEKWDKVGKKPETSNKGALIFLILAVALVFKAVHYSTKKQHYFHKIRPAETDTSYVAFVVIKWMMNVGITAIYRLGYKGCALVGVGCLAYRMHKLQQRKPEAVI
jgi:hypothetical protein